MNYLFLSMSLKLYRGQLRKHFSVSLELCTVCQPPCWWLLLLRKCAWYPSPLLNVFVFCFLQLQIPFLRANSSTALWSINLLNKPGPACTVSKKSASSNIAKSKWTWSHSQCYRLKLSANNVITSSFPGQDDPVKYPFSKNTRLCFTSRQNLLLLLKFGLMRLSVLQDVGRSYLSILL